MTSSSWRSSDGTNNAALLQAAYPGQFEAIAEIDAFSHRTLTRLTEAVDGERMGDVVAVALVRRLTTLFVGVRHLFEASAVEPAKLLCRAQFECFLAIRYLVYGARRSVSASSKTTWRSRDARAWYFLAGGLRERVYQRQAMIDRVYETSAAEADVQKGIEEEVAATVLGLEKNYRVPHARFGPLRCFMPKPTYYDPLKWYSFGFPEQRVKNVKHLAQALGVLNQYGLFYGPFSGMTHPSSLSHDLEITGTELSVFSPHMAEAFEMLAHWACAWQSLALGYIYSGYLSGFMEDAREVYYRTRGKWEDVENRFPSGFFH